MRDLPEVCESCRREVQALERVIILISGEEKRAAAVTFRESVGGVRCLDCAEEGLADRVHPARNRERGS